MQKVLFLCLLITLVVSQAIPLQQEESAVLPSLERLHNIILDENRISLSQSAVDEIFAAEGILCNQKTQYVNCFLGKLKAFIFSVNQNGEDNSEKFSTDSKRKRGIQDFSEQLEQVKKDIKETKQNIRELSFAIESLNKVRNGKYLSRKQFVRATEIMRKFFNQEGHQSLAEKLSEVSIIVKDPQNDHFGYSEKKKQLQKELSQIQKEENLDEEQKQILRKNKEEQIAEADKKVKKGRQAIENIRKNQSNMKDRAQGLKLAKKFKVQEEKKLQRLENRRKELARRLNRRVDTVGQIQQPLALYEKIQVMIFQCWKLKFVSQIEDQGASITIGMPQFTNFITWTFETSFPNIQTTFSSPITMRVLNIFSEDWEQQYGHPFPGLNSEPPCCNGALETHHGSIQSISGNKITVGFEDGSAVVAQVTVCSKLYQLNEEIGNKILFNGTPDDGTVLISAALIYDPTYQSQ